MAGEDGEIIIGFEGRLGCIVGGGRLDVAGKDVPRVQG